MSKKEEIRHKCNYYFAFDIETTGIPDEIIAIGVSVICEHGEEFESKRFRAFVPGETPFEAKCMEEVWLPMVKKSNCKTINEFMTERFCPIKKLGNERYALTYPLGDQYKYEMFESFFSLLRDWQLKESQTNGPVKHLYICSDNPCFDAGIINEVARKVRFFPNKTYLDLPFNQYSKAWQPIVCVDSFMMCANALMNGPPNSLLISLFGHRKHMEDCSTIYRGEMLGITERVETTDHLPEEDAFNIAYDIVLTLQTLKRYKTSKK